MTHAVVWIDQREAHIVHVRQEAADESTIFAQHRIHRHQNGRGKVREHPADTRQVFDAVARQLDAMDSTLIVGPASAKLPPEWRRTCSVPSCGLPQRRRWTVSPFAEAVRRLPPW